jgi:hypothetical protein
VKDSNTQITAIRKISPHIHVSPPQMPPKLHEIEERVAKASRTMDDNPYLKETKAAQQFGATYDRPMARRRGRPPR